MVENGYNMFFAIFNFSNVLNVFSPLVYVSYYVVCMYGHTCSKNMDQLGRVANPASSGQLNREN